MRKTYQIKFSPYLWVKQLDCATPALHVVAEVIADVVDPDGCYCWLVYETIAERACHISRSSAQRAIKTLCDYRVVRKLGVDEAVRALDAAGAAYDPKQPPMVLELLIPASAYAPDDLARINRMRADRGRPAITSQSRPDITGLIGEPPKERSDKGKSAPQRRRKDRRQADAEWAEQQPSLYSIQDLVGDGDEETGSTLASPPMSERHGGVGLSDMGGGVSETHYPLEPDPREPDPGVRPSVDAQPQEESPHVDETDGTEWDSTSAVNPPAAAPGGADAPPVPPQTPSSVAEMIVDGLLADTAHAAPLADPQGDRGRLVALAQSALDRGITPQRLREITSRGLHNVRKQWALATRLADPEGFAQVAQPEFGGRLLPVPAARPPLCETHPECDRTRSGRCAECVVEERLRWIEDGTLVEWAYDAESDTWTDTDGQEVRGDQLTPEEQAAIEEEAAAFAAAKAAAAGGGGGESDRAEVLALVRQSLEDARLRSRRERGLPTAPTECAVDASSGQSGQRNSFFTT
ncbi:hypothetical protein DEF23_17320 [Marinitenerispora sediminis]|uniref:Uncharacterized protein n=1 Tax=Marinitenerispora sediminis TaxID=1931232 RepID=A0A368T4E5_9ACTN|nr:hypothetical protein [Marinitenerispora sediminis]RCV53560.1 hypothetical protein DEF23_17320 [Marinitenerispora sediminis]RCV57658.1 hypothetical protein DEF24_14880 [Marinitenerispora sediminis]